VGQQGGSVRFSGDFDWKHTVDDSSDADLRKTFLVNIIRTRAASVRRCSSRAFDYACSAILSSACGSDAER
jgi:hypothetical protein